jgi:hypothetical protein
MVSRRRRVSRHRPLALETGPAALFLPFDIERLSFRSGKSKQKPIKIVSAHEKKTYE